MYRTCFFYTVQDPIPIMPQQICLQSEPSSVGLSAKLVQRCSLHVSDIIRRDGRPVLDFSGRFTLSITDLDKKMRLSFHVQSSESDPVCCHKLHVFVFWLEFRNPPLLHPNTHTHFFLLFVRVEDMRLCHV